MHRPFVEPSLRSPRRVRRPFVPIALAVAAVVAVAPPMALAQDAGAPNAPSSADRTQAARDFADGERAYAAGEMAAAAELFERAYRLAPHPSALWNAARARHKARQPARAANLYARYLREAPPGAPDRSAAAAALRDLAARVARLDLHAPGFDEVRVDDTPVEGTSVYVEPGTHVVEGRAGARTVRHSQAAAPGAVVSVALVAPAAEPPAATATSNPTSTSTSTSTPTPTPPPTSTTTATASEAPATPAPALATPDREPRRAWPRSVVWVGGAVAVVAAGAAIWSGLDTLAKKRDFDDAHTQDVLDAGRSAQTRTNVLLGVTAGAAVLTGAAALWLVDWRADVAGARAGVRPGGLAVEGRF